MIDYEKEVIRYKNKYKMFRCSLKLSHIKIGLDKAGYNISDLPYLLRSNSNKLRDAVLSIIYESGICVGKITCVAYTSVIAELLDIVEKDFDLHVGFIVPTNINLKVGEFVTVNYMYAQSNSGIEYHFINGVLDLKEYSILRDDIVEV